MLLFFILRVCSLATTGACLLWLNRTAFQTGLVVLGLTHYALGFYYASGPLKKILRHQRSALTFAALLCLTGLLTLKHWPAILVFFGLHHVLSEVYTPLSLAAKSLAAKSLATPDHSLLFQRSSLLIRSGFHTALYLLFVRGPVPLQVAGNTVPANLWFYGASFFAVLYSWTILRSCLPQQDKAWLFLAEALPFFLAVTSPSQTGGFTAVLFYHFVAWAYLPLFKLELGRRESRSALKRYLLATLITAGLIVAGFCFRAQLAHSTFWTLSSTLGLSYLLTLGYFHIGLSFALSRQNPLFIRRFFRWQP